MVDPAAAFGFIIAILAIVMIGGGILAWPIVRRLGRALDAKVASGGDQDERRRLTETVETLSQRVALMEDRLDFAEKLLGRSGRGRELDGGGG